MSAHISIEYLIISCRWGQVGVSELYWLSGQNPIYHFNSVKDDWVHTFDVQRVTIIFPDFPVISKKRAEMMLKEQVCNFVLQTFPLFSYQES